MEELAGMGLPQPFLDKCGILLLGHIITFVSMRKLEGHIQNKASTLAGPTLTNAASANTQAGGAAGNATRPAQAAPANSSIGNAIGQIANNKPSGVR